MNHHQIFAITVTAVQQQHGWHGGILKGRFARVYAAVRPGINCRGNSASIVFSFNACNIREIILQDQTEMNYLIIIIIFVIIIIIFVTSSWGTYFIINLLPAGGSYSRIWQRIPTFSEFVIATIFINHTIIKSLWFWTCI